MYRVYNNQPYECYRETETVFDTETKARKLVYAGYVYDMEMCLNNMTEDESEDLLDKIIFKKQYDLLDKISESDVEDAYQNDSDYINDFFDYEVINN